MNVRTEKKAERPASLSNLRALAIALSYQQIARPRRPHMGGV